MSDDQTIDKLVMDFVQGPFFPHHTGTPEATTLLHALATRAYNKGKAELTKARADHAARIRDLDSELDEQAELIRDLEKSLDKKRADARVLAAEVKEWRAGHLRVKPMRGPTGGGTQVYQIQGNVGFAEETNKAGALERNKP